MVYQPSQTLNLDVNKYLTLINNVSDNLCSYGSEIKVVTLCGSVRFKLLYNALNFALSLKGFCVFSLASFGDNTLGGNITLEQKQVLDKTHKSKIEHSDAVVVINPDNYIGKSTKNEIDYALDKKVLVFFLE